MAQQFNYPNSETELRATQDVLYREAKAAYDRGERPSFKGLIEVMSAKVTIVTAIHNIKANKGANTPGVDGVKIRNYLQSREEWVIHDIQSAFAHYVRKFVRRKYIDKPGKKEKRPLGIPTIRDRIVQECVRIVLEPIMEAQFYEHSYGFRPMRDTKMALERIVGTVHQNGWHWIVEGDISKCFDRIDHSILLKHLYHMGVKDRRLLQIIKQMLKAGIMDECEVNEEGTPQGGILSPLLANVYLDMLDEFVAKQWINKKVHTSYRDQSAKMTALRKRSDLIPGVLVRYADDFVIVTDSRKHALFWKEQISQFLEKEMRLTLSLEKTLITDVRKKYVGFLGYEYKVVRGKSRKGYIPRTIPNRERLKRKVAEIHENIVSIPRNVSRDIIVQRMHLINSQIRGLINYYSCTTWVSVAVKRYRQYLQHAAHKTLKKYRAKWIPANETSTLPSVHSRYKTKIVAIPYKNLWAGLTDLGFCQWEKTLYHRIEETPYTLEGRQLYFERTRKKRQNARLDELSIGPDNTLILGRADPKNNFEYYMNRAYALNRDRLKCRICGAWLIDKYPCTQRINPYLPLKDVNRVNNLMSLDKACYRLVNNPHADYSHMPPKAQRKIKELRKKLRLA